MKKNKMKKLRDNIKRQNNCCKYKEEDSVVSVMSGVVYDLLNNRISVIKAREIRMACNTILRAYVVNEMV